MAVAAALMFTTSGSAATVHKRRPIVVHPWKGYGFLPGYKEARAARLIADKWGPPRYWYGRPGFYRGQWNGGGFGPCWTSTPIGMYWNCGR